jgi:hypothetical protein
MLKKGQHEDVLISLNSLFINSKLYEKIRFADGLFLATSGRLC